MHTNAVDARRAMALVEQADGADGGGPDGAGGAAGRHGADGSSTPAWEASKGGMGGVGGMGGRPDDAAALVRRAKALGVPPLPPDLGAVRYCTYGERRAWLAGTRRCFLALVFFFLVWRVRLFDLKRTILRWSFGVFISQSAGIGAGVDIGNGGDVGIGVGVGVHVHVGSGGDGGGEDGSDTELLT